MLLWTLSRSVQDALFLIKVSAKCALVLGHPAVATATWGLQSPPSPGICVAALLRQLFRGVGGQWEMQGHIAVALVVKHGAR